MRWRQVLLLFCCLCATAARLSAADAQTEPDDVPVLISDNFAEHVERLESPALVKFLIPDCKLCTDMAPDYRKVARNLKGIAPVVAVDCTNVQSVRTCRSYGAHSFPKLLLFKPGTHVNPYTGGAMKKTEEYKGKFTAKDMAAAVTNLLDSTHITYLETLEQHEKFLEQHSKLAKVLLFTDKNVSTVLYKGLSWAYAKRLAFAEVHATEGAALVEKHGVEKLPTLLVVKADGTQEPYTGALKAPPLREFLDKYASRDPVTADATGQAGPDGMLELMLHSLTADNMTEIDAKEDMWLVSFYSAQGDSSCLPQLDDFKTLLQDVQSIVSFGSYNAANMSVDQLQQYRLDVKGLQEDGCQLQLVLFPWGTKKAAKGKYMRWTKGLGDAKQLQEWILAQVPDMTIHLEDEIDGQRFTSATGADLPEAAIKTAADRKGPIGKVILFSTKNEVPALYKALAMNFHGKSRLLFGWTRPDSEGPGWSLMQKMNIRKAPAMAILFPLPRKPVGDPEMANLTEPVEDMAMQQYMGPLRYQKMLMWLQAMAHLTGMAYKSHAGTMPPPSPEHFEIHNQAQLQEACYDKPSLCMIVMVDGRSDMVNKYKDIAKKAALALHGNPLVWVVVDVSRQKDFRSAYGFSVDQLPALVALSTRRKRFAQGAAPFSEENAKQLVTKVLAGTAVTLPLPVLPRLVEGGQEEDETAVDAADEFDLNEIMAEKVTAPITSKEEQLQKAEQELEEEAKLKAQKKKKATKKSSKKSKRGKSAKKSKKKPAPSQPKDEL